VKGKEKEGAKGRSAHP